MFVDVTEENLVGGIFCTPFPILNSVNGNYIFCAVDVMSSSNAN